jgi:hypothetical protein
MTEYVKERLTKSTCPMCESGVMWLRPIGIQLLLQGYDLDELTAMADAPHEDVPTFYICHKCDFIGQVGVGEVKER